MLRFIVSLGYLLWWVQLVETGKCFTKPWKAQMSMQSYLLKWANRYVLKTCFIFFHEKNIIRNLNIFKSVSSILGRCISCSHGYHGWAVSWCIFKLSSWSTFQYIFLHFLLFLVHMKKPDQTQKAATMFDRNLFFFFPKAATTKVGDPHRSAVCLTNPTSGLIFNQATWNTMITWSVLKPNQHPDLPVSKLNHNQHVQSHNLIWPEKNLIVNTKLIFVGIVKQMSRI